MAARHEATDLDRELCDLPQALRSREWMRRIEAVLFASAAPVARGDLTWVVGQGASVDLLVADLAADLEGRSFKVVRVADGWMLMTRPIYAAVIRAAADLGPRAPELAEQDAAVLAAIAWQQPITRDGLRELFGRDISRDLIGRLADRGLIATGPREPRRGAPHSYVTTDGFLAAFGLETLRDLPEPEDLAGVDDEAATAPDIRSTS